MCIEQTPRNITDSKNAKDISIFWVNVPKIVGDIDGNEDTAREQSDATEEPPHQAGEPEKSHSIKTNFIQELWFFSV